eukprot:Ihof_evm1s215 gene=Ihof_evmTU1s215
MDNGHLIQSPILPAHIVDSLATGTDTPRCSKVDYQMVIGTILWIARLTRPDIMFAVSFLGRFTSDSSEIHWRMAMHVIKYLHSTANLGLAYKKGDLSFEVYVDADFSGEKVSSKSTTGIVSYLENSPVDWSSKCQSLVAMSSTEAEFIGLAEAIKDTIWLKHILLFTGYEFNPIIVFKDNLSTIATANSNGTMRNMKHVQLKYNFIKDYLNKEIIKLKHMSTTSQRANIFTKALVPAQFIRAQDMLHL